MDWSSFKLELDRNEFIKEDTTDDLEVYLRDRGNYIQLICKSKSLDGDNIDYISIQSYWKSAPQCQVYYSYTLDKFLYEYSKNPRIISKIFKSLYDRLLYIN